MNGVQLKPKRKSIEEIVESLRLFGCSEYQRQLHGQRLLKIRSAPRVRHGAGTSRSARGPKSRMFYKWRSVDSQKLELSEHRQHAEREKSNTARVTDSDPTAQ
jgi:hypothetical protein